MTFLIFKDHEKLLDIVVDNKLNILNPILIKIMNYV